jgi:predicted dehydrogenase
MTRSIAMGVVGVGAVSLRGIIPHLTQPDVRTKVKLTALCDPVAERVTGAAKRFAVPQAFTDYDRFLREADIEAVTIASPIGIHYQQGKQALLADKHVHFNKTMTITAAEAGELIDLAKTRNLRIVASPGEMLRPHNRRVKELIQRGELGTVTWAMCGATFGTYHEDEPERDAASGSHSIDPGWYFRKPGGGPLFDMTVYALHGLTGILGPARRVTALSGIRIPIRHFGGRTIQTECDDNTVMLLDFGESQFAVVYGTAAGKAQRLLDYSGAYFGTKGTIEGLLLNGEPFDYPGRAIAVTAPDGGLRPASGGSGCGNEWILPHIHAGHRDIPEQHVFADIMELIDWVRDGTPSIVTADHARHVIEIIECAYLAAESGATQTLTTAF